MKKSDFFYHLPKELIKYYEDLRVAKEIPSTCALSPEEYKQYFEEEFKNAMDNDFNSAVAIANTYNYLTLIQKAIRRRRL